MLTVISERGVQVRDLADGRAPSEDLSAYRVVRQGDLVVNKMWARFGAYGVAQVEGIISPAYWVLRLDRKCAEPRFLHYLLRSSPYRAEIWRRSKDLPPNGFDLPWSQFRSIRVLLPSRGRQRVLADFLDAEICRIDALVEKKRRMIDLLEARFAVAVRTKLLDLDAPRVPLKRYWTVIDCKHRTPVYIAEGFPIVSPGDTTPGRLDLRRCHRFVGEEDFEDLTEGGRRPRRGDIIYSRNASIGIASYVETDEPFSMGQDVCMITSRSEDQLFLTYVLNTLGADQLDVAKIGSTFSRVNVAQILEVTVPRPAPPVQTAVAKCLDAMSARHLALVGALTHQIALIEERRLALITAAVTGQMTIPGVAT